MSEPPLDPLTERDDIVAGYQIENAPVRGQIVRLGPAIDEILSAHAYPDAVAALLGEAVLIAALVGHSLKFDGKLIVQASGSGPVRMLAADFQTGGGLRGLAQFDADAVRELELDVRRAGAVHLLGDAPLVMTIDQGPDFDRYQSIAPIEGPTLARAAEAYFERSEQVPTRLSLAVARAGATDDGSQWRAGGALLQRIAADETRGETDEPWERAAILFDTLNPMELVDPELSSARLLYRLFHEDGVRMSPPTPLECRCGCSHARIAMVLASFPKDEVFAMGDHGGAIRVTCEYCNTDYVFQTSEIVTLDA
ncbi:MAG: Hsp33 family molecular chaperone [Maricaulaceae bacterium]